MLKLKVIINCPQEIEQSVFARMESEGLIQVVAYTSYAKNPLLRDVFSKSKEIIGTQLMESGLSSNFENVDQTVLTPEMLDFFNDYKLVAIDMMDRIDINKSYSYDQKKNLFNYLLCYWLNEVSTLSPDIFYSRISPHEVFDYVLYLVCKYFKIRMLLFSATSLPGKYIISKQFEYPQWDSPLPKRDVNFKNASEEIKAYYLKVRSEYKNAMPEYLAEGFKKQRNNKSESFEFNVLKSFLLAISLVLKPFLFNRDKKRRQENIFHFLVDRREWIQQNLLWMTEAKLFLEYQTIATLKHPQAGVKYVYFPLHFQPENTTCPLGGIFNDQVLALAVISKSIPSDWRIYVKEHPAQFFKAGYYGYLGRNPGFYGRIAAIPKVEFVCIDSDNFEFIDSSVFVASVTGTVAWESVLRGNYAVIFGNAWFQDAPNVYRIESLEECIQAVKNIIKNKGSVDFGSASEAKIICYLDAINTLASEQIFFDEVESSWYGYKFDLEHYQDVLYKKLKMSFVNNLIQ